MPAEVESMMYLNEKPWHSLGTEIFEDDAYDIEKSIIASGLNWEVKLERCYVDLTGDEIWDTVDAYATIRIAENPYDNKVLGIVGERYNVLQNIDSFKIFQPFLDARVARLNTAGSLFNGKRVWILAEIMEGEPLVIKDDDEIKKYILLSHSFDGSLAVRFGLTPIRVVCNNTLTMAHQNKSSSLFKIKHTKSMVQNIESVRESIDLINKEFKVTELFYKKMAEFPINENQLDTYIKDVFDVLDKKKLSTRQLNIFERIKSYHVHSPGADGETLWSAYNSITYYLSYDYGNSADTRLSNLWFGKSNDLSQRALILATNMINKDDVNVNEDQNV